MHLQEAGLTNIFAESEGGWVCVNASDVISAAPDVAVIIDANWDLALSKIDYLHNRSDFCAMPFVLQADYIKVSASRILTTVSRRTPVRPHRALMGHALLTRAAGPVQCLNACPQERRGRFGFDRVSYPCDHRRFYHELPFGCRFYRPRGAQGADGEPSLPGEPVVPEPGG